MINKKISSFEYRHSTNLGDEIQSIAAIKAIKKLGFELDEIVDREQINTANPINLLVNGFFQVEKLENLLKDDVTPIFSNIHISTKYETLDDNLMQGFKKFQPIGCRDRATLKIFQNHGIDSFFNYCMTLTLDRRDENIKGDTIFIVDLDNFVPLPKHLKKEKIVYSTQESVNFYSHEAKMVLAGELLERYKQEAKLVITSKLHCALPCIAMGIPVILFAEKNNTRLQLAEEFIPIHPYINIDGLYTAYRLLPYPNRKRIKYFIKRLIKNIYYRIRYSHYYKTQIDWNPPSIDIEEIKKSILKNLADGIEKIK